MKVKLFVNFLMMATIVSGIFSGAIDRIAWSQATNEVTNAVANSESYQTGIRNLNQKQYQEAILEFKKAIQINPNDPEGYLALAMAYFLAGNSREAIKNFDRVIDLGLKTSALYNLRGSANLSLEKYEEAVRDFTEAVRLDEAYVAGYANRGVAYLKSSVKNGLIIMAER